MIKEFESYVLNDLPADNPCDACGRDGHKHTISGFSGGLTAQHLLIHFYDKDIKKDSTVFRTIAKAFKQKAKELRGRDINNNPEKLKEEKEDMEWEYKVVNIGEIYEKAPRKWYGSPDYEYGIDGEWVDQKVQDLLNRLGKEGWELINQDGWKYVFKRQKKGR